MALHLLGSINNDVVGNCLAGLDSEDCLLLLGDGVYALTSELSVSALRKSNVQLFALAEDVRLRLPNLQPTLTLVSYAQWVELCVRSGPTISWY